MYAYSGCTLLEETSGQHVLLRGVRSAAHQTVGQEDVARPPTVWRAFAWRYADLKAQSKLMRYSTDVELLQAPSTLDDVPPDIAVAKTYPYLSGMSNCQTFMGGMGGHASCGQLYDDRHTTAGS